MVLDWSNCVCISLSGTKRKENLICLKLPKWQTIQWQTIFFFDLHRRSRFLGKIYKSEGYNQYHELDKNRPRKALAGWYITTPRQEHEACCFLQASNRFLAGKVAGRAFEHRVPHVSPGEDHLKLVVCPGPCGKVLKEHHHFLKIQFLQLVRPLMGERVSNYQELEMLSV